jgi:uncharacterized metal-binding protein (TIGR02443 family)
MSHKTRFIAGAKCPSCQAQDTIKVHQPEHAEAYFECVRCLYTESMSALGQRAGGASTVDEPQVLSFDPSSE